jgi:two-component system cell cycle sensor histidine kinase/response regulator CckA
LIVSQTILLVDDSEVVRTFVTVILNTKGYNILVADGPDSALALVHKTRRLDLLIADLNLPELSGTRLFEKVSALHPETRPLFISGYTEEEARQLYNPDGFNGDFLGKPFLSRELTSRIESILNRPTNTV